MGRNAQGSAGTGKTETVKDLGKITADVFMNLIELKFIQRIDRFVLSNICGCQPNYFSCYIMFNKVEKVESFS